MPNYSQLRLHVLAAIILAGLLTLVGRLWMLQFTRWVLYDRAAAGNSTSVTYSPAPRGLIRDRNGKLLAENRPVWNVSIAPARFPRREDAQEKIIGRLAGILKVPTPELREKIREACTRRGQEVSVLEDVGEDVPFATVAQIEEQALEGVGIVESSLRSYPRGSLAAHVLGYARGISDLQYQDVADLNYRLPYDVPPDTQAALVEGDPIYGRDSIYGQTGLEREYEIDLGMAPAMPILSGRRGRTIYEVDAAQSPVRLIEQRPPVVGATVYLTLDVTVQRAAEESLRQVIRRAPGRHGAAVVVDVNDGSIIAMASAPSFDPNDFVKRIPTSLWKRLNDDPRRPLINHATTGLYPPASTFKLVSMTAALDTGKCTPQRSFYCPGYIKEGGLRFGCWRDGGHQSLSMFGALAQSCDVYFYELVRKCGLDADTLAAYAREFGLGDHTGLDLPEAQVRDAAGFVPTPKWKRMAHDEEWWTGNSLNMVIGQGYTTVTPVQMALVCAAVANDGLLLEPHLLSKIVWPRHMKQPDTVIGRTVRRQLRVHPGVLKMVREGMHLAVVGEHGTGGSIRGLGISAGAKTGSAEHVPGRPTHAWFTCFAPYDKPRYAITVFVAEGGHGSESAAPVARHILAALYGVKDAGGGASTLAD